MKAVRDNSKGTQRSINTFRIFNIMQNFVTERKKSKKGSQKKDKDSLLPTNEDMRLVTEEISRNLDQPRRSLRSENRLILGSNDIKGQETKNDVGRRQAEMKKGKDTVGESREGRGPDYDDRFLEDDNLLALDEENCEDY